MGITQNKGPEQRTFRLELTSADGSKPEVIAVYAIVEEALSELTRLRCEFLSPNRALPLHNFLGQQVALHYSTTRQGGRVFSGICVSIECLGIKNGMAVYVIEARPAHWLLTQQKDNLVFQGDNTPTIVHDILAASGLEASLTQKFSNSYQKRDYCVQYAETDFNFISRLMEEDGIYYYFKHSAKGVTMVITDGLGQHEKTPVTPELTFVDNFQIEHGHLGQVTEWSPREQITSAHATLVSYDFEVPGKSLLVSRGSESKHNGGGGSKTALELYTNTGRHTLTAHGEQLVRTQHEEQAWQYQIWCGLTDSYYMAPGYTFKMKGAQQHLYDPTEYLVIRAVHYIQDLETNRQTGRGRADVSRNYDPARGLQPSRHMAHSYRCEFEAIPKDVQFRPHNVSPRPNIGGVHTAVVTGPEGEEIHTDQYGRIKVQFHWDRKGKKDQNSSIWVRTMMPWTGKNWGMIAVPRIGNEVVVQFEEGDPDRPLVIGMVYNGANMPPYALPDNKTVSGVKTNSSKGGNGYNELIFEDKKGAELVRFHAERDYLQVVENNARISVGREKQSGGDLTQIVHRNRTNFTGLIDSDLTAGVKSTAVGGAIAETVMGVKTTSVGFHVYETVGFNSKALKNWGWALDGVTSGVAVASGVAGVVLGDDDGSTDGIESFGLITSLKALWNATADFGSFAGPAATAAMGVYAAKGLKPGRTTEINGDVTLEVNRRLAANGDHKTTITDGDVALTVKKGKMETVVEKDVLETVKQGKHFLKVEEGAQLVSVLKGDRQIGVAKGDLITGVDQGKMTTTVQKDYDLKVKLGDIKVKANAGAVTIEAMKSITLKVGTNSIEISQTGIKIDGMMVESKSKAMTKIDGGPMTMVKGAFVMIN